MAFLIHTGPYNYMYVAWCILFFAALACDAPTYENNIKAVDSSFQFRRGQLYTYECNEGYETADDVVTTCNADGTWTLEKSLPSCTGGN